MFPQWIATRSFSAVQRAARDAGMRIGLIADLAIGMNRGGSHGWSRQQDLLLGLSIGAPPDPFNARGQDWGLTGFSPQALIASGFEPFLATLRAAMRSVGGVRIDHVMGLGRLWLVPHGAPPTEGAYLAYPLDDLLRLLAIESHRHRAIVIGEDLGTVEPAFRKRMSRAGVAGMDVLPFQRRGQSFLPPAEWRRDAVAMTTTHDLPPVAGWWKGVDIATRDALGLVADRKREERERATDRSALWRAFRKAGVVSADEPDGESDAQAVDAAVAFTAQSPAPLALVPIEDILGLPNSRTFPARSTNIRTGGAGWVRRHRKSSMPRGARPACIIAQAPRMTPRATIRLQFHQGFTFADAERHVSYIARLGVSHVYASPITTARAGSMHGYDVVDPTRVNPELGGEDALKRFVATLRGAGLGLIVDIVPNHMAVGADNAWWFDVLKYGEASRYAPFFDIDWDAEDESLRGKVLLPVLGKPLHEALDAGEITLVREANGTVARYFQQRFPIDGDICASEPLDTVLSRQHYQLAWWRIANDEINWRRFFDINELAGLRMEHPPAFEDVHALIFRLYAEGLIDGVRVDHVDGLADPARYCRMLRSRLDALTGQRPAGAPHDRAYIIVEKILLRGETLPADWDCDGTSGYDFMNEMSALQHDESGAARLGALWQSVSGRSADFAIEEQAARREIIARSFSAQLEACTRVFHRLAHEQGEEVSRASLRRALTELLVHFPVYRTYATASQRPPQDKPFARGGRCGGKADGSVDRSRGH